MIDFGWMTNDSNGCFAIEFLAMPEQPHNLIPEVALLAPLPDHLRQRFTQALTLMHDTSDKHYSWEKIAMESAISPYHFHRQFTELFNETPGHYLGRLRLQIAVNLLMSDGHQSITDIAQASGFSSSQALSKAIKRELGVTAKQIRNMRYEFTPKETSNFIAKLNHPGKETSIENALAEEMPCELIWYPQRGIKTINVKDADWDYVLKKYREKSVQLLSATPINQVNNTWNNIDVTIGNWQVDETQYNFIIQEGYYLCSDVYLASDAAYLAALENLFSIAENNKLTIDPEAFLIEIVRDIQLTLTGGVTFSFQIPILSEPE